MSKANADLKYRVITYQRTCQTTHEKDRSDISFAQCTRLRQPDRPDGWMDGCLPLVWYPAVRSVNVHSYMIITWHYSIYTHARARIPAINDKHNVQLFFVALVLVLL